VTASAGLEMSDHAATMRDKVRICLLLEVVRMRTDVPNDLLDRVRKLLAKAENEAVTPAEAEALTAKAAELMARYGIDRARLGALHPETDRPADRMFDLDNPWAGVKAHLLAGLAMALRCQCILLRRPEPGSRVHVFGYLSDLERADILFTSLLVQMARALALQPVPVGGNKAKAWRRSWMLGYCTAVTSRRGRGRSVDRTGARRPGADRPPPDRGGLPPDPQDPRHLHRLGLPRRIRRGAEGRHRQHEDQVADGRGPGPVTEGGRLPVLIPNG
jgi:Protein of unknown function (DUF2786)